jgi:NTP pyrophosphatase (non-canonical NTP hydrolase)
LLDEVMSTALSTEYLIPAIEQWAHDRNLIHGSDPKSQTLKLMSEVGELSDNINKQADCRDDIGDCLVVLIILANQKEYKINECLQIAYDSIKNRKGILFDGVYIKDTDERYEEAVRVLKLRENHLVIEGNNHDIYT